MGAPMSGAGSEHRVALFMSALDGGGAERVMLNVGQGLVRRGIAVDLLLVYPTGPYTSQIDPGIRVVDLDCTRLITAVPALARYLRRERPNALIAALEDNNVVVLLARALSCTAMRCIVTVHNHLSLEARYATKLRQRFAPHVARLFYRFADTVVAVSRGVAEDLASHGVPQRLIRVVYNPIYSADLLARAAQPIDHPWLGKAGPPVIMAVGRLVPQKDHATLLDAFARIRHDRTARLLLLGDGPERAALEARAGALGIADAVAFIGFVDNPYAWMARATTVVLSSVFEGFGNVLVEAMAVGTPVVSTDCPSGPAEVLKGGRFGRLVQPRDPAALAEAILATLDEPPPASRLSERAAVFSLEQAVDTYQRLAGLACRTDARAAPAEELRMALHD